MSLTEKRVAKLMRSGAAGWHHDAGPSGVRSLYLVVRTRTNASWQLRYQLHGRARIMGLGSARTFSLGEARERARQARQKLADKVDPLAVRAAERVAQRAAALKSLSFAEAAQAFYEQHEAGWKNRKHAAQVIQTLKTYAFPVIGSLPVDAVDTPTVLRVLRPIWKDKPETASRVRGRIESVLGWATVSGYRSGDNPARWRGHLEEALPRRSAIAKVAHHAALPYRDIPNFMVALGERDGVAAQALAFTILTAARTGEVLGARWAEIDLEQKVWTVPSGRMKAGKEHKVPLSQPALDILRDAYREKGNDHVFIGGRGGAPMSSMAMAQLLKRMGLDVTVHGFRSGFRVWAAEQTNFPREVAEQALAHTISDKVEAAYKRTTLFDRRRALMAQWAKYCTSPPKAASAKVVAIRGAQA